MPLDRMAALNIDGDAHRFTWFGRSAVHEDRAVNENVTSCLCVEHAEVTYFGAIMPGNV